MSTFVDAELFITPSVMPRVEAAVERDLELLTHVRRLAAATTTVVLADSPPNGGEAYTLFGRLRDELWQLGATGGGGR